MALNSRLAIIVGGLGGIGSVTARALRAQGASLSLLHAPFEQSKVSPVLESYGPRTKDIRAYSCDIAAPDSVAQAFDAIAAADVAFPSILVNAAGYITLDPFETFAPDATLKHLMINLYGPILTSQAFARLYLSRSTSKRPPGRIVNIASQAAHIALHHHGPYCASKAGLLGATRSMASEWGPHGITANSISPGPVWTALGKKAWADDAMREEYQKAVPTGAFAEPEEVARVVEFLVADGARNVNGEDVKVEGGYTVR